jgi:hypothetical protein
MYARWLGVLLCLLLIHPAEAAVHRCVDAQGKTYYSDSACPMASGARREQPQDAPVPETTRPAPAAAAPSQPAPVAAPAPASDWIPPSDEPASASAAAPPAPGFEETHKVELGVAVALRIGAAAWLLWIVYRQWGLLGAVAEEAVPLVRLAFVFQNFRAVLGPLALFALSYLFVILLGWQAFRAGWVEGHSNTFRCTGPGMTEANPSASFTYDDLVCLRSTLSVRGGGSIPPPKTLQWRWYQGGAPGGGRLSLKQRQEQQQREAQATTDAPLDWNGAAPREVLGQMSARQLGSGAHSVSLYVGGQLTDTVNFEVR